ncbi:tRNA guanosine(34) transglycosylase Tgt [Candidatus Parcubacteria bacterium]|nr:MAG: tRNA guanosine(34) transglycosylase Tgt [Candidatus Parcubacteria bacterium]
MFTIKNKKGKARAGELSLPHGVIQTPFFMPIATKGAVKGLDSNDLLSLGAQIVLSNTYHLFLRPGQEEMKKMGGLHKFMNWNRPILTDSGGYQVFSLSKINKTTENGVIFKSYIDGKNLELTPEISMAMQAAIGSDIIMQFDDVAAGNSDYDRYKDAMERSLRWAKRCLQSYDKSQKIFGIVQGGIHWDLREFSAKELMKLPFDGYAIGGLSVGEPRPQAFEMTKKTCEILPPDKPRYFMGGGMPEEIVYYVSVGVDMFDCVLPTRNARHGSLFLWAEEPAKAVEKAFLLAHEEATDMQIADALYRKVQITSSVYVEDTTPIDIFGPKSSQKYTKAYLRHLLRINEILGYRLATLQNLGFYLRLMAELRKIISSTK